LAHGQKEGGWSHGTQTASLISGRLLRSCATGAWIEPATALTATPKGAAMNWDQIEGNWKQAKGEVKTRWGKLTDDDLTYIDGQRDRLIGKLQEYYGISKEEAEREIASS
jgi:uncharacterized protein YjbJ (UPF0337 family)